MKERLDDIPAAANVMPSDVLVLAAGVAIGSGMSTADLALDLDTAGSGGAELRETSAPSLSMLARVNLAYLWRQRRTLDLHNPRRFTELVQWRKLHERDPRMPLLIDKVNVKHIVARQLGDEWVTPTLWTGLSLPSVPYWPKPFVVKSRHGCNQRRFVRRGTVDWGSIQRASAKWMRRDYGFWLDEHGYRHIPRGLLIEPFVGDGGVLPIDYKLYVFHGRVSFIQVHLGREDDHRWLVFDRDWRRVSSLTKDSDPPPPASLMRMIEGAEVLGRRFDFVRIDFYEVGDRPRFGEMTFYPGSGLDPFDPPELDLAMGALWLGGCTARDRP